MKEGDIVDILEGMLQDKRYVRCMIEQVYNKGRYNMYLCKNIKTGCRLTFTDKDLKDKERCYYSKKFELVRLVKEA